MACLKRAVDRLSWPSAVFLDKVRTRFGAIGANEGSYHAVETRARLQIINKSGWCVTRVGL